MDKMRSALAIARWCTGGQSEQQVKGSPVPGILTRTSDHDDCGITASQETTGSHKRQKHGMLRLRIESTEDVVEDNNRFSGIDGPCESLQRLAVLKTNALVKEGNLPLSASGHH